MARNNCTHNKGFTFKKTKTGTKRTCKKKCGFSVTEIGVVRESILDIPWKNRRRKGEHHKDND